MNAPADYPLLRDAAERQRLATQALFWADDAAALFDAAGVARGSRVADLGCGTAHVATQLARRVGRRGRVFALDADAAVIDRLAPTPSNVEPVHADCYATPFADESLDAVHARFVAAPCGRIDALLREMMRIVRPGGLLMLQEPIADSWRVPAGAAWARLRALIRAGFAHRGGNFDIGRTLRRHAAGQLAQVRERRVVHTFAGDHPYAALPLAFCAALAGTWRAAGLAGDAEREELQQHVAHALRAPGAMVTTFTLVQVWGRKPLSANPPSPP